MILIYLWWMFRCMHLNDEFYRDSILIWSTPRIGICCICMQKRSLSLGLSVVNLVDSITGSLWDCCPDQQVIPSLHPTFQPSHIHIWTGAFLQLLHISGLLYTYVSLWQNIADGAGPWVFISNFFCAGTTRLMNSFVPLILFEGRQRTLMN